MASPDADAAPGLPALDDDGWEDLLNYIEKKRVTPIVGPELLRVETDAGPRLLYDWLATEGLNQRERFTDHSRETFDAVLDTCERIAREKFAPFNRLTDSLFVILDANNTITGVDFPIDPSKPQPAQ